MSVHRLTWGQFRSHVGALGLSLPLYFFRMVAKGIIFVFCYFALLASISKSVDAIPVSMRQYFNPFVFFCELLWKCVFLYQEWRPMA